MVEEVGANERETTVTRESARSQIADAVKKYDDGHLTLPSLYEIINRTIDQLDWDSFNAGQDFADVSDDEYEEYELDVELDEDEYNEHDAYDPSDDGEDEGRVH